MASASRVCIDRGQGHQCEHVFNVDAFDGCSWPQTGMTLRTLCSGCYPVQAECVLNVAIAKTCSTCGQSMVTVQLIDVVQTYGTES